MFKKRIVTCIVAVVMLAMCMVSFGVTALADITEKTFSDAFNEGSDFMDNDLYQSSSKVSLFKKTSGLKSGIDGAAVSALAVSEVGSVGEIVYYAPKGIKSFSFDSRASLGSVKTVWDESVHCNKSYGNITTEHLSKSAVAYVSTDGTTWLNPYSDDNNYEVVITWGTSTYDNWSHFLYTSQRIPENVKYVKIAFPAMNFVGSSQVDNLSVRYNYEPTVKAESRTFTDDFNKGVTAETANKSTGVYYKTDEIYYASNNVTGFLKTDSINSTAKNYSTPHKYAALTSNVTKDSTGSAYITYYAPGGITGFNFVSRFNSSNTSTANEWSSSLLVNTDGNVSPGKQPLLYVSADGTNWVNPYNNNLGYKISYYWPDDNEKDSVYSGWNHLRCKSVSIPENMKYLKIVFPYAQWVGATQIDDLAISYKYYPNEEQKFKVTDSSSSKDGSEYTYSADVTSNKAQNVVMIIAYYKGDALVGAAVSDSKAFTAGGSGGFFGDRIGFRYT